MAQSQTVYANLAPDAQVYRGLFNRLRIWIARRVPQRSTFVRQVRDNGGQVVALEKDADVLIADHMRTDVPPGSLSFRWIEACVRDGRLVDKEEHRAGPKDVVARPVGSLKPATSTRLPYTAEDDLELYNWVKDNERRGGKVQGNTIYKQLFEKNPRHPWQSWRDRYVKYVRLRPPPPGAAQQVSSSHPRTANSDSPTDRRHASSDAVRQQSPPAQNGDSEGRFIANSSGKDAAPQNRVDSTSSGVNDVSTIRKNSASQSGTPGQGQRRRSTLEPSASTAPDDFPTFGDEEYEFLYESAPRIQSSTVAKYSTIWKNMAQEKPQHSAEAWQEYYEIAVLPKWKEKDAHHLLEKDDESIHSSRSSAEPETPTHNEARLHETIAHKTSPNEQVAVNEGQSATPARVKDPIVENNSPSKRNGVATMDGTGASKPTAEPSSGKRKAVTEESPRRKKKAHFGADLLQSRPEGTGVSTNRMDFVNPGEADEEEGIPQRPQPPAFQVYESRAVPEGEKENVILNEAGSPTLPERHRHVKSEEALEVFTDPPHDFMLEGPNSADENEDQALNNSWRGVDDVEATHDRIVNEMAHDDALDAAQGVADEAEREARHDATAELVVDTNGDYEILDELRDEYEKGYEGTGQKYDHFAHRQELDTQAILDGNTQMPDFELPLPREQVGEVTQDDEGSDEYEEEENDEDASIHEPDLEVPPPLADVTARTRHHPASYVPPKAVGEEDEDGDEDEGVAFDSSPVSQSVKGVFSPMQQSHQIPRRRGSMNDPRRASSTPRPSPTPKIRSRTQERGQPIPGTNHPTVSGITVRPELHDNPRLTHPNSSPAPRSHHSQTSSSTTAWAARTSHSRKDASSPVAARSSPAAAFSSDHQTSASDVDFRLLQSNPTRPFSAQKPSQLRRSNPTLQRSQSTSQARTSAIGPSSSDPAPVSSARPPRHRPTTTITHDEAPLDPTNSVNSTLQNFITAQSRLGQPHKRILYALQRTNMNTSLALLVLRSLANGTGVPKNVKGVFTEEDDEVMRAWDARSMRKCEELHGREEYRRRREFMGVWGLM